MTPLTKIRNAGFDLLVTGAGELRLKPFSKLTPVQLDYLKSHKAEIIAELEAEEAANDPHASHPTSQRHQANR